MNNFDQVIQTITVYAIPVLFAISLHEAAHGYVARYFGDNTAERLGRLSPNPLKHIDLFGTILLPLMLKFIGAPPFGYAKPVPVDFSRLRNPKKQMGFVAAAGPAANFVMGLGWMLLLVVLLNLRVYERFPIEMCKAGVIANSVMCAFNLLPIPPLDGGRIVTALLPRDLAVKFASIERLGPLIFLGLILLLNTGPFRALVNGLVGLVMTAIELPFRPFLPYVS
ncbi:site-2 protease family protein [Pseudoduganella eburnea]|uniref:Site-2 protease family protein n=1 Tax=Massilia eburnea TaxID=1776165 RepID=A0A6L6QH10_9BURK|nr:site-2 protease family protein [Massilia eburnea]MTW11390.1 site-2 protease family protein [Massilia eburnea]